MKRLFVSAAVASSLALGGCATNPQTDHMVASEATGAAIGAGAGAVAGSVLPGIGTATGAIAGAVLPGLKPGTGAVAGAILGGVLGATVHGRQYYRDTRGYCYYVDQYGQPHYSYDIRC